MIEIKNQVSTTRDAMENIRLAQATRLTEALMSPENLQKLKTGQMNDANSLVGGLLRRQSLKDFLPNKPAEGEKCYRSNHSHLQSFMPDGSQILFNNHFLTTSDPDVMKEVEAIAKATRSIKLYEGPWAGEEVKMESNQQTNVDKEEKKEELAKPKTMAEILAARRAENQS